MMCENEIIFHNETLTFYEAEKSCKDLNGNLPVFKNYTEWNETISKKRENFSCATKTELWTGFRYCLGTRSEISGTPDEKQCSLYEWLNKHFKRMANDSISKKEGGWAVTVECSEKKDKALEFFFRRINDTKKKHLYGYMCETPCAPPIAATTRALPEATTAATTQEGTSSSQAAEFSTEPTNIVVIVVVVVTVLLIIASVAAFVYKRKRRSSNNNNKRSAGSEGGGNAVIDDGALEMVSTLYESSPAVPPGSEYGMVDNSDLYGSAPGPSGAGAVERENDEDNVYAQVDETARAGQQSAAEDQVYSQVIEKKKKTQMERIDQEDVAQGSTGPSQEADVDDVYAQVIKKKKKVVLSQLKPSTENEQEKEDVYAEIFKKK